MSEKEIMEGNKLIAVFQGWKVDGFWWIQPNGTKYNTQPDFTFYHSNWNALMPVVEKIGKMYSEQKVPHGLLKHDMFDCGIFISISMLWHTVVDFIKFHNQQK